MSGVEFPCNSRHLKLYTKLYTCSIKSLWNRSGWPDRIEQIQAMQFRERSNLYMFSKSFTIAVLWWLLMLTDLPVHPEPFLPIAGGSSRFAVWPCHWHVESRVHTGWNAYWWTVVRWLQWGMLMSSNKFSKLQNTYPAAVALCLWQWNSPGNPGLEYHWNNCELLVMSGIKVGQTALLLWKRGPSYVWDFRLFNGRLGFTFWWL